MKSIEIKGSVRTDLGKKATRELRKNNGVPCVVYGVQKDENGNPVQLDYIDFIKVYTGNVQEAGWLGETSTEFAGIVDLHPQAVIGVTTNSNSVYSNKAYRSANKLFNLTKGDKIQIFRMNGTIYYQGQINNSEMEIPSNGVFVIKIINRDNTQILR